jgi:hypothetical protein
MLERIKRKVTKRESNQPESGAVTEARGEVAPKEDNIVIFGARSTGAYDAAAEFQDYLRSIDPKYEAISIGVVRHCESIDRVFGNQPGIDATDVLPPPVGVIIFPQMRAELGMLKYTVPSPVDYIATLCEESEIPYIVVSEGATTPELAFPGAEVMADGALRAIEEQI